MEVVNQAYCGSHGPYASAKRYETAQCRLFEGAVPFAYMETVSMKISDKILALVAATVGSLLLLNACSLVGSENGRPPQANSSIGYLDSLPDELARVTKVDVEALFADSELEALGEEYIERWEMLEDLGIFLDEATYVVEGQAPSGTFLQIGGSLDHEAVRNKLYSADFDDEDYRETELWIGRLESIRQPVVVGFISEDQLIVSWPDDDLVKDFVRARETGRGSFTRSPVITGMLQQLPVGAIQLIVSTCGLWDFRDCVSWSRSVVGRDEFTAEWTWVFAFEGEREARFNVDDVTDRFRDFEDEFDLFEVDVSHVDQFVKVVAAQDKEDVSLSRFAGMENRQ